MYKKERKEFFMNIKGKLKKFFTLHHRANDGFTLVELIIVIAILAILAGVSVPVYNGYTQKARESADQMIIAAANDAFEAACMENAVDAMDVTEATVSVMEGKVYGLSSATYDGDTKFVDKAAAFFINYFEGNGEMVFQTPGINSLIWNDALDSFEMKEDVVDLRVVLSGGKALVISAEDMAMILASAYADMGADGVTAIINRVTGSSKGLVNIAKSLGLGSRFTEVLKANGLIVNDSDADGMSADNIANGLQMVTAKHLSGLSEEEVKSLASMNLGFKILGNDAGTYGVLKNLAGGDGGTVTVAAVATQYALAEAYTQTEAGQNMSIKVSDVVKTGDGWSDIKYINKTYSNAEEFLNSEEAKADPVWAMNTIKAQQGYKDYTTTEQYTNDLNGFVGSMSVLGDNIGTTTKPGAIDINDYFENGVNGDDAQDALTAVLGK